MILGKLRLALSALAIATPLSAQALTIDIDTYLTGSIGNPGGNPIVATLTLTQNGSNVDFRLDNKVNNLPSSLGDDAFISKLLFSYDGTPPLTTASFTAFGGTQSVVPGAFGINPPGVDAGYDFFLDLDYPSGPPSARFTNGEFTTWTILGVSVLDFDDLVTGSGPPSLAMVHIQQVGAGPGGAQSLKYVGDGPNGGDPTGIPEPGTLGLLGLALAGLGAMRRRIS